MRHLLPLLAMAQLAGLLAADGRLIGHREALIVAVLALTVGPLCLRGAWPRALLAFVACFALGAASLASRIERAEDGRIERGFDASVEATVEAISRRGQGLEVELTRVEPVGHAPQPLPAGLLLVDSRRDERTDWLEALRGGERLRLRLHLRATTGLRNPGGFDRGRALARRGIGGRATLVDPELWTRISERDRGRILPAGCVRALAHFEIWRRQLALRLGATGRGGALLRALTLGDRSQIDRASWLAFAALGITHLLAVSGLHLALAIGFAWGASRWLLARFVPLARRFDSRLPALWLAACVASAYALLAGFALPVRRALIFVWGFVLTRTLGRRVPASQLLALASLLLFSLRPAAVFELGAQLSFGVCAALLVSAGRAVRSPESRERSLLAIRLESLLASSAVAMAASAPILVWHGHFVSTLALLGNLLAVPWTSVVMLPAALLAVAAAAFPLPFVSKGVLVLAEWLARASLWAAAHLSHALPAAVSAARPGAAGVIIGLALAGASARARRTRNRVAFALLTVAWLQLAPAVSVEPPAPRLVALDVGQGDSFLIQGRRVAILIDGGRASPGGIDLGARVVLPALRTLGVHELALVIASHADNDHCGGLVSVLRGIEVAELWLPYGGLHETGFERLRAAARERGVRVQEVGRSSALRHVGAFSLSPLWPPRHPMLSRATRNDLSLVVMLELAGRRALFTGDLGEAGERALLASGAQVAADILKVGHHGSVSSSSSAFLAAVRPRLGLVSAPCGGRSGLPAASVLERLEGSIGRPAAWTGRLGALFVALSSSPAQPVRVRGWAKYRSCLPPLVSEPPVSRLPDPTHSMSALPLRSGSSSGPFASRRTGSGEGRPGIDSGL